MTFKQLQDEVLQTRFDEDSRTSCKRWLNTCESKVWAFAEWAEKGMNDLALTVTGGTATAPLPTGMTVTSQALEIYDNFGNQLTYMEPESFFAFFEPDLLGAGSAGALASAWTLTTDPTSGTPTFRLGPTPAGDATFRIQGWNLPIHRDTSITYLPGVMANDSDLPWWPDGFEGFLVPGAMALGLKEENDPTWQPLEAEFNAGLATLRQLLLPGSRQELRQWGDSTW